MTTFNQNKKYEHELNPDENIQEMSISREMETSFIDYAMSVIVSRAIPDARDGFKPVHRRILYAMNGLDMVYNKPYKKSARAVGEVIAKYHPHGDTAVYDAMVRLAQPFSMRYPLVWGQGNFGSIDGDGAAAMRYTEARLHKSASLILEDIKKNTVDFQENYDGAETEPIVLPGKLPNLLINGTVGIAVGMATSIPPHNLNEVLNASEALLKDESLEVPDLLKYISAPDFPTGGIIVNRNELGSAYKTGRGRVITRAKTRIEFDEAKNSGVIYITEIPYAIKKAELILKIADLQKNKIIDSLADIRDESNREGIRIILKLKKGYIPEVELNKLFKLTPLQSNFQFNLLALVNKRPETLNLKSALKVYNDHQLEVLVRKTKFELEKAEARRHILEGLKIALDNIDDVIDTIKQSIDNQSAITSLRSKYNLSEEQGKAILEMRLNRLTGLERNNLEDEITKLTDQIEDHNLVINSKEEQVNRIISMFNEMRDSFGDARRTEVSEVSLTNIEDEDLIPEEEVVITMSKNGYIKRLPIDEYRVQNRGGQGSRGAATNEDDYISDIIITSTHADLLFFTSNGKVFRIRAHQIPQLGKTAKGLPIVNLIQIDKDEDVKALISMEDYGFMDLVFVTENGIVKKTNAHEFERINRNGKIAITLKDEDHLLGVTPIPANKETELILGNSNGKAIRFHSTDVRAMGRTAAGVKGISLDEGKVVDFASSAKGNYILSISVNGFGKLTEIDDYRITNRGGKGVITINTEKAGELIGLTAVKGDEDLMIITDAGTIIRTQLSQISSSSRNTKGVTIVKLREGESITSVSVVRSVEEIENEILEKTKEVTLDIRNLLESNKEKTEE